MTDHLEPPNTVADMTQPPRELAELIKRVDGHDVELKDIKGRINSLNKTIEDRPQWKPHEQRGAQ